YCPSRIRRVVPGCPWPRPKNNDKIMMSSILVAMNSPTACAMEDRITHSPPQRHYSPPQCRPGRCTVRPHRRPGSCPPAPSVPESGVGRRSHSASGVPGGAPPQSHSPADRPDGLTRSTASAQGSGRVPPDTLAHATGSTGCGTAWGQPWLDPSGSSHQYVHHSSACAELYSSDSIVLLGLTRSGVDRCSP